jgi:DNA-binding MarR family transcriptional regulator
MKPIEALILSALYNHGICTYAELEKHTDRTTNQMRFAAYELKKNKLINQVEDTETKAVAWMITSEGKRRHEEAENLQKAVTALVACRGDAVNGKNKAKTKTKSKQRATPAGGGADNTGSQASDSPVGAATSPAEGLAVVETRAGSHEPEAVLAAAPAVSDELHLALDHKGQLTIGELRFSPADTRLIGQFLIDTEPAWN